MSLDPFHSISEIWLDARAPLGRYLSAEEIEETDEFLRQKAAAVAPRIMVFGVYNAGKSSLINALLGQVVAPVADVPMTAAITTYAWSGGQIDDTPGIDAPIEHEAVAREHLQRSDAVLFVLGTDSTFEEARIYDEIISIVRLKKPILIVLNNKVGLAEHSHELLGIRDAILRNLQKAGHAAGIRDIEGIVSLRMVNAKSALKARLENKQALLHASGLPRLEADMGEFVRSVDITEMVRTGGQFLSLKIDHALALIPVSDEAARLERLAERVAATRAGFSAICDAGISAVAARYMQELQQAIQSGSPEAASQHAGQEAVEAAQKVLAAAWAKTAPKLDDLERHLMSPNVGEMGRLPGWTGPSPSPHFLRQRNAADLDEGLNFNLLQPILFDKEAIVGGFQAAKQLFPALFKGLGPKFFARAAPFVGPAIQVGIGIFDYRRASQQAKDAAESERRAAAELDQWRKSSAKSLRDRLMAEVERVGAEVFQPIEAAILSQRKATESADAAAEADRTIMLGCRQRLLDATETPA